MIEKKFVCIRCPIGCHLTVKKYENGNIKVFGNSCPRGEEYGKQEMTEPRRTVTTIKPTSFGCISLKTDIAIRKEQYFDVLKQIDKKRVTKEYNIGDIFIKNILGTKTNIVVTGIHKDL